MPGIEIIWDIEDDPEGNVQHIAEHGVTVDEVTEVLEGHGDKREQSRSSGLPIVFGWTSTGKHIAVVYEQVEEDPLTVYR